ncbi:MAG: divalent-cation tolerance protein CutA [Puniceicoccales bacterium]|jgi:periplasmic divalent cation tolerance protein|nr:divalent-cation tolerance protein CutA [Puniceicoccales bacterium]
MQVMENKYVVILTSVPSEEEAETLAEKILIEKLAACIQIYKTKTFYIWNDTIKRNHEFVLAIKTKDSQFAKVSTFIKLHHSYQVPEIVQISITDGSKEYLNWINTAILSI